MLKKIILSLPFFLFLISCQKNPSHIVDSYIYIQKKATLEKKWKLIWEDNFNNTQLDTTKWSKINSNEADWGKHMTHNSLCYKLHKGKLFLKGINTPDSINDTRKHLTGGIYTKNKFAFQYGKIEICAKLECAQGAWPAIWMLAETNKYGNYPKNGEIDIMEHLNYDNIIYQTTHSYYTLNLKQKENPPHYKATELDINKFNVFGLKWFPDKLIFTINGKEIFIYPKLNNVDKSQWPYDQPFYLLIDQQLGGSWVGKINSKDLPVNMIIDWVKVYQ